MRAEGHSIDAIDLAVGFIVRQHIVHVGQKKGRCQKVVLQDDDALMVREDAVDARDDGIGEANILVVRSDVNAVEV